MGYLRLLLVLTISMCIDKNLASCENLDMEDFLNSLSKMKTDKEIFACIGPVFNFFHKTPWVDRLFWVLNNISLDFGVGREKDNWGWGKYWGKSGCGLILYPDVYKSKWLKIGFLDFRYNFIGRIAVLLRVILGYSQPAGYGGKEYWNSVFEYVLRALFLPKCSILYFKFFGFFSVGLFSLNSLLLITSAFDSEMSFLDYSNGKLKVDVSNEETKAKFKKKYYSRKGAFWNLNFVIDFDELFKIFNKEESDPDF